MWQHALPILILLTNTVSCTESASNDDPHWVKYNPANGPLPADAIVGGYGGYDNETLYIARAPHVGSLTPGKYIPSTHQAIISWGWLSHVKTEFEILCGHNYKWVPTTTENIPEGSVVGGYIQNSYEPLYVGRVLYSGQLLPGKVAVSHGVLYFGYQDREKVVTRFEILVKTEKPTNDPHWVKYNPDDGPLPADAIVGGYENETLYIARGPHVGSLTPGKYIPSIHKAIISSGWSSHVAPEFEILCGRNYKWVPTTTANIPEDAVVGGYIQNSYEPLYVGRVNYAGQVTIPGKVAVSHKVMYFAYGDREVDVKYFEILVKTSKPAPSDYPYWIKFNPEKGSLPADAIVGGYGGRQNETFYIARAPHVGSLTPGKYVPSIHQAVISWGWWSHNKSEFEILCGRKYKWVPTTVDYIPEGSVVGGYIQDTYEPLFVGRVHYSGQLLPGKVAVTHGVLYFGYEDREIDIRNFEILVYDDKGEEIPKITGEYNVTATIGQLVSIECKVTKGIPKPTISWQFKAKDNSSFVSVPGSENTLNISNVDATDEGTYKCVASNDVGDDEHLTELIVQNTNTISKVDPYWREFDPDNDSLPPDAIVGGYQNETLYIARAPHQGSLSPGMYVPSTHKAYVSWSDYAHPKTKFEILCGNNYKWESTTTDYIPDDAVIGGYVENSHETEYIGRTRYAGNLIPGRVQVSHEVLYFAYKGKPTKARNFEILVVGGKKKPKITGSSYEIAENGQNVNISCRILKGEPTPTIRWQFKSNSDSRFTSVQGSDNVLQIFNVNETDAGIYKCIAANELGNDEHLTELIVQNTNTISKVDPYWREFDPDNDSLPPDAIVGGYQNEILYIARAPHQRSLSPGMYVPSTHKAYVTWSDYAHPKTKFEILCGNNYKWVPATTDYIPDDAVIGGYVENSHETEYIGRTRHAGNLIPGRVQVSHEVLYFAYKGKSTKARNFEILVVAGKKKPKITGSLSEIAENGQNVNISCRVLEGDPTPTIRWQFKSNADLRFTSVQGSDNVLEILNVNATDAGIYKCIATNEMGNDEHPTELIVQKETRSFYANPHWIHFDPDIDALPADAIIGGYQNETLYIARAPHEGTLTPAMYVPSTHKAYITSSVDAHPKNLFEILCGRNYKWIPTTTDYIPEGAVVGGYIENSYETAYIGRTNYSGYIIPGKVDVPHGVLYFAYGGKTQAVRNFDILVLDDKKRPRITGPRKTTIAKGPTAYIECVVVEGAPTPRISWQFKSNFDSRFKWIPGSDSTLQLSNVSATDAGLYKCIAENDQGHDEHITEVFVTNGISDPYWLSFNPDTDELPADAIVGGFANETLYFASAPHKNYVRLGTYVPSLRKAFIPLGNTILTKKNFKILRGDNYYWSPATTDDMPERAYDGSYVEGTYERLYIARANYLGNVVPGRVALSRGVCQIIYGDKEEAVKNFEVLVVPEKESPRVTGKNKETVLQGQSVNIECKVVRGIPEPTMRWEFQSNRGPTFVSIPGSGTVLRITRANLTDAGTYKCIATNDLGWEMHYTELIVEKVLDDYGFIHEADLYRHMETGISRLKCGSGNPFERITWYKSGVSTETTGESYTLENVDLSFEGNNYTCVVSSGRGTEVHTFVLTTRQSQSQDNEGDTVLDLTGREGYELNCDIVGKATPNISWTFNGKLIENQKSSRLTFDGKWGNYTCKGTTANGTLQRSFDITSSKCIFRRETENVNTPFIQTTPPITDYSAVYMKFEPGQTIILSCPDSENGTNTFQKFRLKHKIEAQCLKEDQLIVKDRPYKFSELVCAQEPQAAVVAKKHQKCWTDSSELLVVGNSISESYEVCFDTENNIPLYIPGLISKSNPHVEVSYKWQKYRGFATQQHTNTCEDVTSTCCYTKSQLMSARDVSPGPAQRTTFIDPLNAVMVWRPCDLPQSPWEIMEITVRMMTAFKDEFKIWSGTYKPQHVQNGTVVPRYLWKALEKVIALIYINGPSPSEEDILCTNICGTSPPWPVEYRKHIYCCHLEDFLHSFGLEATDVGDPLPGLRRADSLQLF